MARGCTLFAANGIFELLSYEKISCEGHRPRGIECRAHFSIRPGPVHIHIKMSREAAERLYLASSIFLRPLKRIVDEFAKCTPQREDIFLHSLCVNKVSNFFSKGN